TASSSAFYEREMRAFSIDREGGTARELNLGHCKSITFGPNGGIALARNADDPARWKRYRGGTSGEIWVDTGDNRAPLNGSFVRNGAILSTNFVRLRLPDGNPVSPMWLGDRLYFLADH